MILSNVEVHKALDEGRLKIDPEPFPRTPTIGQHCPYDTHSVDLRLSAEIAIPDTEGPITYDLSRKGGLAKYLAKNSTKKTIIQDEPFRLQPNTFILARTIERVSLPIIEGLDHCLAARIEGKSSRARIGLLVHFTAPTVHPGFEGTLTLEMINLGPSPILLEPGIAIAQLIVEQVLGVPVSNPSQFQGQSSPEGVNLSPS